MYEIFLSDKASEQLSKLSQDIGNRIGHAIEKIRIRPEHFLEKLVGSPYYKLRVGDYRLILDIRRNDLIIFVIELGHRRNIYK